jgi:ubiquinone/menaquinone biosynthesis C-methylase UbiE
MGLRRFFKDKTGTKITGKEAWYSPSKLEIAELYDTTSGYWDSFVQRGVYGYAYKRLFRHLQAEPWFNPPSESLRAVDCGTGSGLLLAALDESVEGDSKELFAIDLSSKMLDRARRRLTDRGIAAQFDVADVCSLPFRDSEMDIVMSALVLEHINKPVSALREMMRIARPNAWLVLVVTLPNAPDLLYRLVFRYRHYQDSELFAWMREAGIQDVSQHSLEGIAHWFARAFICKKPG